MSTEFWIQMVVYAVSIGSFGGVVLTKLAYLEKKMDIHNKMQDRLAIVEQSAKSAHHRMDEIREDLKK